MLRKKIILSSIVAIVLCTSNLFAADKILATVGGENITLEDADNILKAQKVTYNQLKEDDKKSIATQLVDKKILSLAAMKSNIINSISYKETLNKLKEDLALQMWMSEMAKVINVSEAQIKAYYEQNKYKMQKPMELKANHILVKTEKEALDIIDILEKSKELEADFIKIAKSKSTDAAASKGGDLGWFTTDKMIPEFSMAASTLKVGTITAKPVKTKFGYHIIYLDDKKTPALLSYAEVKADIKQFLSSQEFNKKVENILKAEKAKIKISFK
ncbi:MAG: foldase protein PrsA [Arcobacteraceae bacterium]|jgi:peptidyl-prolyl cis-trans isomerase C